MTEVNGLVYDICMNKRTQKKQETKEKIAKIAKQLFIEQGFAETKSRQIAEKAGVGLGTIFSHFNDKNAMLSEILLNDLHVIISETKVSEAGDLIARLKARVLPLYQYYAEHPNLSRALLKNVLFDVEVGQFQQQLTDFMVMIHSDMEFSGLSVPMKRTKLFMASYFWVLNSLLNDSNMGISNPMSLAERKLKELFELSEVFLS